MTRQPPIVVDVVTVVERARQLAAGLSTAARELGHDLHPWAPSRGHHRWVLSTACRRCGRTAIVNGRNERIGGPALDEPCPRS